MYVVMTLGPAIGRYIDTLQKRHEYADAVALSAMADEALFPLKNSADSAETILYRMPCRYFLSH